MVTRMITASCLYDFFTYYMLYMLYIGDVYDSSMFDDINMKATIHQMCAKNSIKKTWYMVCGMINVCLYVYIWNIWLIYNYAPYMRSRLSLIMNNSN